MFSLQEMDLNIVTHLTDSTIKQDEWLFSLNRTIPNVYVQVSVYTNYCHLQVSGSMCSTNWHILGSVQELQFPVSHLGDQYINRSYRFYEVRQQGRRWDQFECQ
jgi:hypothetical protein